jgi:hypothetical protein
VRRTRTAILACTLTLTACTGTSNEPASQPPATTATTATKATPTEPTPPELPTLARQKTTAGAKAFVTYYIDLLNNAWELRSGARIRQASSSRCAVCRGFVQAVEESRRRGGTHVGGDWVPVSLYHPPFTPVNRPVIVTAFDVRPGYFTDARQGRRHRIVAARKVYEFEPAWDGQWLMADVRAAAS